MANNIVQSGIPLSPKQFIAQWKNVPHKFQVNIWNFEIKAGRAAVDVFRESFSMKRFNDRGSIKWAPRSPKNRHGHELMIESGSLRQSIKWKHLSKRSDTDRGVLIFTDPKEFVHTFHHKGFCFAAVHNAPSSMNLRRGAVKNMPQRQFMGHSSVLKEKLNELSNIIFEGFPK